MRIIILKLVFFIIPEETRWDYLEINANQTNIAEIIENAIEILENKYPKQLQDVIPKVYLNSTLDHYDVAYLINLFPKNRFWIQSQGKYFR